MTLGGDEAERRKPRGGAYTSDGANMRKSVFVECGDDTGVDGALDENTFLVFRTDTCWELFAEQFMNEQS